MNFKRGNLSTNTKVLITYLTKNKIQEESLDLELALALHLRPGGSASEWIYEMKMKWTNRNRYEPPSASSFVFKIRRSAKLVLSYWALSYQQEIQEKFIITGQK